MQSVLQKLFSKKFFIQVAPWVFLLSSVLYDVFMAIKGQKLWGDPKSGLYYFLGDVFIGIVMVLASITYMKHEKNVMKAAVGAMLGISTYEAIYDFSYAILYQSRTYIVVFSSISAALFIAFLAIHLILASDHKARPTLANSNVYVGLLIVLIGLIWSICSIVIDNDTVFCLIWKLLTNLSMVSIVLFIESNVDLFKQKREAA